MILRERRKVAKLSAQIVIIGGIAVLAGWMFDIGSLKSISPAWVSMKFDTALSFVLSGTSLYFIVRAQEGAFEKAQIALSITTLILVLIMGILFFSSLFEVYTGTENLFLKEAEGEVKTVSLGRPSFLTMIGFMLVASAGIMAMLGSRNLRLRLKIVGSIIAMIGFVAIIGYTFDLPFLYYFKAGISSAMAVHTAAFFILLGIGLLCL